MKKKFVELSVQELLTKTKGKHTSRKIKDSEIDYSDIPELDSSDLKKLKRVGRPLVGESPRKAISVRIETEVLARLKARAKKKGIGYQSLINKILKKAV
jgi:uncharacterized protein (DUF4415 family)